MKTGSAISEVYKDVNLKTLYIEHDNDVWNIVDGDNILWSWNEQDVTQQKINRVAKKFEREKAVKVIVKFKLKDDISLAELKNLLNKNWDSIQKIEEKEGKLIDSYINDIISEVKKNGLRALDRDKRSMFSISHSYSYCERRLMRKEELLALEAKAVIDKLFNMIEEGK